MLIFPFSQVHLQASSSPPTSESQLLLFLLRITLGPYKFLPWGEELGRGQVLCVQILVCSSEPLPGPRLLFFQSIPVPVWRLPVHSAPRGHLWPSVGCPRAAAPQGQPCLVLAGLAAVGSLLPNTHPLHPQCVRAVEGVGISCIKSSLSVVRGWLLGCIGDLSAREVTRILLPILTKI